MRLDTLTLLTPCCGQEVAIEWGGTVECPECLERWVHEHECDALMGTDEDGDPEHSCQDWLEPA